MPQRYRQGYRNGDRITRVEERPHSFGYWLRRRRKALDLTQEQLAQSVACSRFAIRKIEAADERQADHPARLINLGIAHARLGDEERARELFREAASNTQRYWLETSEGRWADAREIARVALAKLDSGELAATQLASR